MVARLWTAADLAERWGCSSETVLDRVRTKGVPFVWLGPREPRLTEAGQKFIRFRPAAVEAWEARQECVWAPCRPEPEGAVQAPRAPAIATGTDGKVRLGGRHAARR